MISGDPALLALASLGLRGAPPPLRTGWADRLDAVEAHGLSGMLAWSAVDGRVEIDGPSADRLLHRLEAEAAHAALLEAELTRLAPVLRTLPILVIGGVPLAHDAYPEPVLRPVGGLDLLVPGQHAERVVAVLADAGYQRAAPPHPGAAAGGASAIVLEGADGLVVNLHHELAGQASIDVEALLARHRTLTIGSATVAAAPWEALLLASALEAASGPEERRALAVRDVAQVALRPELDVSRAIGLAHQCQSIDVLAAALGASAPGHGTGLDEASLRARFAELRESRTTFARMPVVSTITRALAEPRTRRAGDTLVSRALAPTGGLGPAAVWSARRPPVPEPRPSRPHRALDLAPVGRTSTVDELPPTPVASPRLEAPALAGGPSKQDRLSRARPRRQDPAAAAGGSGVEPPAGPSDSAGAGVPGSPSAGDAAPAGNTAPPSAHEAQWAVVGAGVLVVNIFATQLGASSAGVVLVPLAALLIAVAAARHIKRRRPDENWVGRWLLLGVAVKVAASYFRYYTLVVSYKGGGDATGYDDYGRRFVLAWTAKGPDVNLPDLKATNFVRWFTGVVYYLFGTNMVCGFFVFGLLALVGSYLWYRAAVHAVPALDKRLCFGLLFFAPSIAFWPSSIGKEALMQLGIGGIALGAAFIFRKELVRGLLIGLPGGWLVWVVRPHLLALVALSVAFAFAIGRVRGADHGVRSLLGRPIGLLVMTVALVFAVSQATKFLGIDGLSISSIENELDQQTERSAQGGSQFDPGGNYLNPLNLPRGMATVLLRPFPWETDSSIQLLASLESALLVGLVVIRLKSLRFAISRARAIPFLMFCLLMTILYSATYSAIANFGLLVRQRSLVLPAVYVLLAVLPIDRRADDLEPEADELPRAADARR